RPLEVVDRQVTDEFPRLVPPSEVVVGRRGVGPEIETALGGTVATHRLRCRFERLRRFQETAGMEEDGTEVVVGPRLLPDQTQSARQVDRRCYRRDAMVGVPEHALCHPERSEGTGLEPAIGNR